MDHSDGGPSTRRVTASGAGTLTTRPLRFSGRHLFVNVDAPAGLLRVEVLDRDGRTMAGYSAEVCDPVRGDSTRARVTWGGRDLATLAGDTVRFRFHLSAGRLYAFWVSATPTGASRGYVAAGGPAFSGIADA
jgi:hypothetical protein